VTDLDRLPFHDGHESPPTPNGAKGARPRKSDDPVKARRGRTARARGNAYEREVAHKLGGRRVGQYGDKVDVDVPGYLRVQCKNGVRYPKTLDGWLRAIPVEAGLLRAPPARPASGARSSSSTWTSGPCGTGRTRHDPLTCSRLDPRG
jgi:hypothetical protein